MSHAAQVETESTRSQSLLGIVTSMVGILIVLVMLVGERVKRIPDAPPAGAATEADLKPLRQAVSALEGDLSRAAGEMVSLESEIANRHVFRSNCRQPSRGVLPVSGTVTEIDEDAVAVIGNSNIHFAVVVGVAKGHPATAETLTRQTRRGVGPLPFAVADPDIGAIGEA